MQLEVRLFASLRELVPKENRGLVHLDFPEGGTVQELVKHFRIPEEMPLIIMINGRREQSTDRKLNDGDRIGIFPPVGGG